MRNPFDILTSTFIDRPKVCLSIGLIGILTVSSMAMFIEFDNSEDAFFPDNETVRLPVSYTHLTLPTNDQV